jgi:Xaa-Pro aminopeptidase
MKSQRNNFRDFGLAPHRSFDRSPSATLSDVKAMRLKAVQRVMREDKLDGLIVTSLTNIRWLTGFTGSNAIVVMSRAGIDFITDGRYGEQALNETGLEPIVYRTSAQLDQTMTRVSAHMKRVGLDPEVATWSQFSKAQQVWCPHAQVVAAPAMFDQLRAIKDADELRIIKQCVNIADQALAQCAPMLLHEPTERDVSDALEAAMRRFGADRPAYDTLVASGPNGAMPHHHPNDRRIVSGDLVIIDVGAEVDGYRSDMTRTFAIGRPTKEHRRFYDATIASQAAGVAALGPGTKTSDVDAICRKVLKRRKLDEFFITGTGHGVGLVIHEHPFIGSTSTWTLAPRNVVTVEPGVYVGGVGGVRIEDLCLVTAHGCEVLTQSPKTLDPLLAAS